MRSKDPITLGRLLVALFVVLVVAGCGSRTVTPLPDATTAVLASPTPPASEPAPTVQASALASPTAEAPSATSSQPPDTGGGTTAGDIPDNAVFLTYRDATHGFAIVYVEGWQVTPGADGVVIRDKDSSETVAVVPLPGDLAAYIGNVDLPALASQSGFTLVGQDTVKAGAHTYAHVSYHLPAPPDPVTGKRVPSTIDRYYVPGLNVLAIVSLSTPDGVDNVDAFRQMIASFRWS
jgi:hypothetical protein